jgi:hypothetical protein
MINDGCSDANRQVLIKGVGEHLLPTAQARGFGGRASWQRLHAPEAVMSTRLATSFQVSPWSRNSAT